MKNHYSIVFGEWRVDHSVVLWSLRNIIWYMTFAFIIIINNSKVKTLKHSRNKFHIINTRIINNVSTSLNFQTGADKPLHHALFLCLRALCLCSVNNQTFEFELLTNTNKSTSLKASVTPTNVWSRTVCTICIIVTWASWTFVNICKQPTMSILIKWRI
jgi:hypothetical protein